MQNEKTEGVNDEQRSGCAVPQSRTHLHTSHAALFAVPRSFMYRAAVSVLIFYVAFTQPNCPTRNSPLLTFKIRNLLPLCRSRSVGSVTVLSAVLKSNRNVWSRILHQRALNLRGTILLPIGASLRTYKYICTFREIMVERK